MTCLFFCEIFIQGMCFVDLTILQTLDLDQVIILYFTPGGGDVAFWDLFLCKQPRIWDLRQQMEASPAHSVFVEPEMWQWCGRWSATFKHLTIDQFPVSKFQTTLDAVVTNIFSFKGKAMLGTECIRNGFLELNSLLPTSRASSFLRSLNLWPPLVFF